MALKSIPQPFLRLRDSIRWSLTSYYYWFTPLSKVFYACYRFGLDHIFIQRGRHFGLLMEGWSSNRTHWSCLIVPHVDCYLRFTNVNSYAILAWFAVRFELLSVKWVLLTLQLFDALVDIYKLVKVLDGMIFRLKTNYFRRAFHYLWEQLIILFSTPLFISFKNLFK